MPTRNLPFPVFDADNHMYETEESFTRHLPAPYKELVKYVQVGNRTKIVLDGRLSEYIPNPTFTVVAAPGAQEEEFKLKNPNSARNLHGAVEHHHPDYPPIEGKVPPIVPEYDDDRSRIKPIRGERAFHDPEPRLAMMDELGIDYSMMWPTLASLLEERLVHDPVATHVVVHALNEWMHEHWSFDYEGRIFATPVITLPIVDRALAELEWVLERGAKAILIRPATVPDFGNRRRSFALPEFDPFWEAVQEADVLVGMHASDSGYQKYLNEWEGHGDREFLPFDQGPNYAFRMIRSSPSPVSDTVASIIGHELAHRFPDLRFAPVENGSEWVRPLLDRMGSAYERKPEMFPEDPVAVFKRCIYVHPFHEEDPVELIDVVGADNVIFGSDYPHPEGMADPITFVDQLNGLDGETMAKVMGGNLARIMKVDMTKHIAPVAVA